MKETLRKWRFEIVLIAALTAGLFLLLEQISIRTTLRDGVRALSSSGEQLFLRMANVVVPHTASDAIGLVLVIGVLLLARWRLRWWLQRTPSLTVKQCPSCGGSLHRIHRKPLERAIEPLIAPVHRYVCSNPECRWQGLRVDAVSTHPKPSQAS